ncbi:unnamed protein product [Kuraishia capsulata CBS 1993]|uniref:S1 motif domain-containing protein n=1 Tax=Kuraishia capsulata CBS 1993 TaxID=1382522 RepID=W6MFS3_9ASCO|nr:uncharacterized protein KUCA_T00000444001 [Kuraishia capsulata CBS 1993]CDK24481.1 unnamed protein product [Kuraishia capsulata CBS 1993]
MSVSQKRKRSDSQTESKTSIDSTEISFPRGGGSVLTALEVKEISNEATRDVLFESKKQHQASAGVVKKRKGTKGTAVKVATVEKEKDVTVDHLDFKTLVPGSQVLGQIVQINKMDLVISIADNLVGFVPITSISQEITEQLEALQESVESSDEDSEEEEDNEEEEPDKKNFPNLSEIFQLGQWLRATVITNETKTKKKSKKRLELSIEPSIVNSNVAEDDITQGAIIQVSVKSVEDHGVILNTGKGTNGFISKKELDAGLVNIQDLHPGSVILVSIASINSRTITCKIPHGQLKKQGSVSTIDSITSIIPGMLVDALITGLKKDGIVAKVFGLADSSIGMTHLGVYDFSKLKEKHQIGSKIKARVIASFVLRGEAKLILSTLPHVLFLNKESWDKETKSAPLESYPIGKVVDVTIIGKDGTYIYTQVEGSLLGQVHYSRVSAKADLDMDFKIGSEHKARVLGYSWADNALTLTLDKKQIEQKYLRVQDIPIGEAVVGEVVRLITDNGLILKIFDDFEAFVPRSHMSDIKLIYPERKFKIGSMVKARVLKLMYKRGKASILCTLKKSLVVTEDEDIVASFEDAQIGKRTPATVERMQPNGCIVAMFGQMKAFLPNSEISETFVKRPEDHLRLGQTIRVRIISSDSEAKRTVVSCRISDSLSQTQLSAIEEMIPGKSVIKVSVVEKEKDNAIVEMEDSGLRGIIAFGHLSDKNYEQNRALLKKTEIGSTLEAVVLMKDRKSRILTLSAKESLVKAAKEGLLPASFEEISIAPTTLHGFVSGITNSGVFVAFANKLTGLVLPKYASDKFVDNLNSLFYVSQSVSCHVIRTDIENKRFLLSLKSKETDKDSEPAINPVDSKVKTISEFVPGLITKAQIKGIKATQLNVQLADNQQGRIDVTQLFDSYDDIKNPKRPTDQFKKGDVIDVKIIGFHDTRNHKFLPVTNRKTKQVVLELSAKKSDLGLGAVKPLTLSNVKEGEKHLVFINNSARGFLWAGISPVIKGKLSLMDLCDDASLLENLEEEFPVGCALMATIKEIEVENATVTFSARSKPIHSIADISVGDVVPAKVLKTRESYLLIQLCDTVNAISFITDALNDYSEKLDSVFSTNDICAAKVLEIDSDSSKVYVSVRTQDTKDKLITSLEDVKRGDVLRGFVKAVTDKGVLIALGRNIHAFVKVSDLSDSYIKEWKKTFHVHDPVQGKIIEAKEESRILMTLKDSEVNGELNTLKRFEDVEVGEIYEGSVRRITDFGVFVKLDGTLNITGLCHHSEISDKKISSIESVFGEGDRVKVKLLAKDDAKKQLSLGMKASYFIDEVAADEDIEMEDNAVESSEQSEEEKVGDNDSEDELMEEAYAEQESGESDSESDKEVSKESAGPEAQVKSQGGLSTNGFDWTASILDQTMANDESSDEEDMDDEKPQKKKRRASVVKDKTAEMNTRAPQSVSDFERLLIGNPNSSILWMNYMSFQLQLSEIEKAREIGSRALNTINYREEQEKLNIWIALLNLENSFGSDETLEDTFKRACQYMDSFTIHQKLVGIFSISERNDKAEELLKTMTKKFGSEVSVWVSYASFLLDAGRHDDAREVLARALQVLPKRSHIETVRKFAQLEFSKGDSEQGRSLFEGLITDAAKRIDLWNVYIDQEIKRGEKAKAEMLFERVLNRKLSRTQAKFFFNKWLNLEEDKGDDKGAEYVKAKAAEYAQNNQ